MKLSIKPVALAVTMALGAAIAQAQTLPTMSTGTAYDNGANDGLYLAIWDNGSKATDLVSLTSLYSDVAFNQTTNTSILTTPTVGSNGWSQVSNFDGFATVDQLNIGSVSNFSSVFPSVSSNTNYEIVAANTTSLGVVSSAPLGLSNFVFAPANQSNSIHGDSASWNLTQPSGPAGDTAGTASYNEVTGVCSATLCDGSENSGVNLGVNVGSAAGFYNWSKTSSRNPTVTDVYSYNGQQGFFFLSDTGQLTWNLVPASVPLPPAVWLFASGLLGLIAIGRRRQAGFGPAV